MKHKFKKIIVNISDDNESEVYQRLAFTLNYSWPGLVQQVRGNLVKGWGLLFDPNDKHIEIARWVGAKEDLYHAVYSTKEFLDALQNPIMDCNTVDAGNGIHNATIFEDGVTFRSKKSRLVGTVTVPKEFLLKVASQLEPEKKGLPIVQFHYPDSNNTYQTLCRTVKVTKFDDDFIWGFEIVRGGQALEGDQLKKYVRSKVSHNQVTLVQFLQE